MSSFRSLTADRSLVFSCRKICVFIQESIATLSKSSPEKGLKLYLDASLTADRFASIAKKGVDEPDYAPISYELLTQAVALYEEQISDGKVQYRCITSLSGTLLALRSISKEDYESLITKTAQFSAKVMKKPDQCELVALCAHLFYPVGSGGEMKYNNPQRALECLQRSLKLADACTSINPAHVNLFVDLLEHYVFFFEKNNPLITHAYVTGLVALIKEHLSNLNALSSDAEAKAQFAEVVRYIKLRKADAESAELFAHVQIGA
jgi:vacuolar protein sorting-associated protein 35